MYRPIQVGPTPPQWTIEPGQEPPTPNVTNSKLHSKRGRITAIACVPCKKRKSKCNGVRPTCNTCAQKGSQCGYDMGEEHRWQGTLRLNVKKLERELEDLKSVLPLFATSSEREAAAKLAVEIQKNGFAARSVKEVREILLGQSPMAEASQSGDRVTKGVTRLEVPSSSITSGHLPESDTNVQQTPISESSWSSTESPFYPGYMADDTTWSYPVEDEFSHLGNVASYAGTSSSASTLPDSSSSAALPSRGKFPAAEAYSSSSQSGNVQLVGGYPQLSRSTLSSMCSAYVQSRRQLIADGHHPSLVLGPPEVDVETTLRTGVPQESHPVGTWAAGIATHFLAEGAFPEKLATAVLFKDLMRWQISPSKEHFENLPDWLRPVGSQTYVPHDPLVEYLPWPAVRDLFIHEPAQSNVDVIAMSTSVNWPFPDTETFFVDPNTNNFSLTGRFEAHVRDLNNWTLGEPAFEHIPALKGRVRMTGSG